MKVKDAMHEGVAWFTPDASVVEIARKMREEDIGSVPIGENDRLVGMVTDRDITCRGVADGKDISSMTAREVMSQEVVYCRSNDEVEDAARIMETRQIRRLPVIDENKRMVGILSLGDIAHAAPQSLSGEVAAAVSDHHS